MELDMKRNISRLGLLLITIISVLVILPSCKTGTSDSTEGFTTINGDFAMVYAERNIEAAGNPTDGVIFSPGGDLMYKDASIPSIVPINITSGYTQGLGDVSDPDVNFDGTKIVFAMRGPNDQTFNLWEMDVASKQYYPLITDSVERELGNDVDPAYLPDGRIVFTSDRQKRMQEMMVEQNIVRHKTLDEYEREEALLLHVLSPNTQEIEQISFNQSHDRNPTVLKDGRIMFSRWEHVGNRNHFPIFTVNPDGTNMFVMYGAFSPGNSFLHPREMKSGHIMSSLMPLSETDEGGPIMSINTIGYSENCEPAPGYPQGCNGQKSIQFNNQAITFDGSFSPGGRYTSAYPLWDGTNRTIASYAIPPNEFIGIPTEVHPVSGEIEEVFGPSNYQIWMLDFDNAVARVVQTAPSGKALFDPIPIFPRALSDVPNVVPDKPGIDALAVESNGMGGEGMGILGVKSVYDTDFLDIMGDRVIKPALGESIPKLANGSPDLISMKDPSNPNDYLKRPAYFVRISRALPTPPGISMRAIGRTSFEMVQVLGNLSVEPDGSILGKVPADSGLRLELLDRYGRAFQTHTNWLQVRPGEVRTCNGCHSPRRSQGSINISPISGNHSNALGAETMAETRARLNNEAAPTLSQDLVFNEYWSNGLEQNFTLSLNDLTTPVPTNGQIDYVQHIQPLWEKDRGADTCTGCHQNALLNDPLSGGLTLEGGLPGKGGHVISYDQLLRGPFKVDLNGNPLPPIVKPNGRVVFPRMKPLVRVGDSAQSSRTSHLVETIYHQELRAGKQIGPIDHSAMMTDSEKWLVSTWIDIGAQYTNVPYELVNGQYVVRDAIVSGRGVSRSKFNQSIYPILKNECMVCHTPEGDNLESSIDPDLFVDDTDSTHEFNRFILTGNEAGDFNVTRAMINDLCDPQNNDLLLRPKSDNVTPNLPHPQKIIDPLDPNSATQPIFANTGPGSHYDTILTWISMGAASNPTCL